MTSPDLRRVRTLRLSASDASLVRRGTIILEDALHTASLPCSGTGRLLFVRSFFLSKIMSNQSSASVALAIEQQLTRLSAEAVHGADPAAPHLPAVYFHDEVEPYILLAGRLARDGDTRAWFWPQAVPVWRREVGRSEGIRRVFFGVMRTRPGPAAGLRMARELHQQSAMEVLLASMSAEDGPQLLEAFGWSEPGTLVFDATTGQKDHHESIPTGWSGTLHRWVKTWGARDARSLWLAGVALMAHKPARLQAPDLVGALANRLLDSIATRPSGSLPSNALDPPYEGSTSRDLPAGLDSNGFQTRPAGSRVSGPDAVLYPDSLPSRSNLGHEPPAEEIEDVSRDGSGPRAIGQNWDQGEGVPDAATGSPPGRAGYHPHYESSTRPEERAPESGVERAEGRGPVAAEGPGLGEWEAPLIVNPAFVSASMVANQTEYAGLFFLVPVLANLGIADFLDNHPHWIEHELPFRLLRYIWQVMSVQANDPIMWSLDVTAADEEPEGGFVAPTVWRGAVGNSEPWVMRRIAGRLGARVLFDGSGQLPVALWRGAAPPEARTLLGGGTLKKGTLLNPALDLDIVLKAWHIALSRWCQSYAMLELDELIRRSGLVFTTPTHIDVLMDHGDTDVRVRRAGLDLDPGWVPWLGRVVYFHYMDREQLDELCETCCTDVGTPDLSLQ